MWPDKPQHTLYTPGIYQEMALIFKVSLFQTPHWLNDVQAAWQRQMEIY